MSEYFTDGEEVIIKGTITRSGIDDCLTIAERNTLLATEAYGLGDE